MRRKVFWVILAVIVLTLGAYLGYHSQDERNYARQTQLERLNHRAVYQHEVALAQLRARQDQAKARAEADPTHGWQKVNGPVQLPILMYHSISTGNSLRMPPEQLRQQMTWLKQEGYDTLTPEEAYLVLTTNKKPADKIVWITFDDGYRDNLIQGLPIFKALHIHATINDVTGYQMLGDSLSINDLKTLKANGISIESHTVSHKELPTLAPNVQQQELTNSKQELDHVLHQRTMAIAYPVGRTTPETPAMAQQAGYQLGVTTKEGLAQASQGLLTLDRVRINPGVTRDQYLNLLRTGF
ncbi:polysaccharide deacetylase family protein [Agrilactobacillus fermenti]|uniref:polysaccharide deacetylase family protein n=1 Tax=Agrilactobacillus fermenti TaxID=2586909 RepID=UPI001E582B66|nr:polysaccharide deacetylase family protein [Agrilactobacillus fermenti]MCD2256734.1 polysaccharide deacetylase family protein [Agrilactobacillus fermenti]